MKIKNINILLLLFISIQSTSYAERNESGESAFKSKNTDVSIIQNNFSNIPLSSDSKYEKIAVVDIQRVLEESKAVQSMQKQITKIGEDLEKLMSEKESELKKHEEEIIKKRGTISEEEFEKKVSDFNKRLSDTQRMMQDKKTRLDKAHANAMAEVQDATIRIIKSLSKKENFTIVLPTSHLLYFKDENNITKIVIKELNKELQTLRFNY